MFLDNLYLPFQYGKGDVFRLYIFLNTALSSYELSVLNIRFIYISSQSFYLYFYEGGKPLTTLPLSLELFKSRTVVGLT